MVGGRKFSVLVISFFIVFLLLISIPLENNNVKAQDYSFQTLKEYCSVYIEKDGSVHIKYEFEFIDELGTLDGVDIGMPNSFYSLESASARVFINDNEVSPTIQESPYIPMGIAVEFNPPRSGSTIRVLFRADNPHMVYDDVKNNDYVGIQFRPTWFSSEFQSSNTQDLQVWVYLPKGFNDLSKVKYLEDHPYSSINWNDTQNRLVAHWDYGSNSPAEIEDGDCDVGVSFPDEYVDVHYRYRVWQGIYEGLWIGGSLMAFCCFVIVIAALLGVAGYHDNRRHLDYFEPKMSVKGAGPRPGLTAVEAAIVLEKPLNIVATILIYGMLRKQAIQVVSKNPLKIQVIDERKMSQIYERRFAKLALNPDGTIYDKGLKKTIQALIESVKEKISGFHYVATKVYYGKIVERAWIEVENSGTPEVAVSNAGRQGEWLLLDPTYNHRIIMLQEREWYTSTSREGTTASGGPNPFVKWSEGFVKSANNISKSVVSNLKSFTKDVVKVTNPLPKPSPRRRRRRSYGGGESSDRGGFSGGGGGCACACACACAGGGR
jgi:hypothetical protein